MILRLFFWSVSGLALDESFAICSVAPMVGAPKTISDLARLDANPLIACRRCEWQAEYDRARLIALRLESGLGTDWRAFCAEARCERCGGAATVTMRTFVTDRALRSGDLRRQLVFKALCVLAEAGEAAKQGQEGPSFGLRFALAYLYAVGERSGEWFDREPYVTFWREVTQHDAVGGDTASVGRHGAISSSMNAIARAGGIEITPDVLARLREAIARQNRR